MRNSALEYLVNVPLKAIGLQLNRVSSVARLEAQIRDLKSARHENDVYTAIAQYRCEHEYKKQQVKLNERTAEYGFALECLRQVRTETVLDVGTGLTAWPAVLRNCGYNVTATDSMDGYWGHEIFNRHFHIVKDDITDSHLSQWFDVVTCISTLEHIPDHTAALRNMVRLLKPGGCLVITVPYCEYRHIDNVYLEPGAGYGQDRRYICRVFSRHDLDGWQAMFPARLVSQAYYQVFTGEFWTFGTRISPPVKVDVSQPHQLTGVMLQRRQDA